MSDSLQELIENAVFLIRQGPSKDVLESFAILAEVSPDDLLPELFFQIDRDSNGINLDNLCMIQLMPDAGQARNIIVAVASQNKDLLRASVTGDYADLLVALLAVIAVLKESSV